MMLNIFRRSRDSKNPPKKTSKQPSKQPAADRGPGTTPAKPRSKGPSGLHERRSKFQKKLLAFRTISAMLARIPEEEPFEVSISKSGDHTQKYLPVLTAFATLGVIDKGVMAVVAKIDPNDPTVLEVIATTQTSYNDVHYTPPPFIKGLRELLELWFTENPPKVPPQPAGVINFIDVNAPVDMQTIDDIKKYINLWESDSDDAKPSLATHLYILKQALLMKSLDPEKNPGIDLAECASYMRRYVVATSHQKIRRRMTHDTLSMPFYNSLTQVPRPIVFSKNVGDSGPTPQEQLNDKEFLAFVALDRQPVPKSHGPDAPGLPITNLLAEAQKSERNEPFELYSEATCDEFHAFFLLCLNCFKEALDALKACNANRLSADNPNELSKEYQDASSEVLILAMTLQYIVHGSALRQHLHNIEPLLSEHYMYRSGFPKEMRLPTMRRATVYSREQDHKQTVEAEDTNKHADQEYDDDAGQDDGDAGQDDGDAGQDDDDTDEDDADGDQGDDDADQDDDDADQDDDDADQDAATANDDNDNADTNNKHNDDDYIDLAAVQPGVLQAGGSSLPFWTSYKNWLKLLLVPFDSIDVLVKHFGNIAQHSDIKIRILEAPSVEEEAKMLSLRELLSDKAFFPNQDPQSTNGISNKALLKQFTKMSRSQLATLISETDAARSNLRHGHYTHVIHNLATIAGLKVSPWSDNAQTLIDDFDVTTFPDPTMEADDRQLVYLRKFAHDTESLHDSIQFLNYLLNQMKLFTGNFHCEAILATVLSVPVKDLPLVGSGSSTDDLWDFGSLIGVSKHCCPVCRRLLTLLTGQREGLGHTQPQFIVRGSHKTVTACSLPPWLPEPIVDSMIKYFGDVLRLKLVKFHDKLLRGRPASTGSGGLSLQEDGGQVVAGNQSELRHATGKWIPSLRLPLVK